MVNLLVRVLNAVGEPQHDVAGVVGIDALDMLNPGRSLVGDSWHNGRCPVEVETGNTGPVDPAAVRNQSAGDQLGLAGYPRHLLDGTVLIEPPACFNLLWGTVVVQ